MKVDKLLAQIEDYFLLEKSLEAAALEEKAANYNALLEQFLAYNEHPGLRFPFRERTTDLPPRGQGSTPVVSGLGSSRICLKLSRYEGIQEQDLYACYASAMVHLPGFIPYERCFWWRLGEESIHLQAYHFWPLSDASHNSWRFHSGSDRIRFNHLPPPSEVVRFQPPVGDPAAVADYYAEK